jgi:ribokinase
MPTEVVDTTGAGDCFSGVLAAAVSEGISRRSAVARANAAAGLSVSADGARRGIPSRAEIDGALSA